MRVGISEMVKIAPLAELDGVNFLAAHNPNGT